MTLTPEEAAALLEVMDPRAYQVASMLAKAAHENPRTMAEALNLPPLPNQSLQLYNDFIVYASGGIKVNDTNT